MSQGNVHTKRIRSKPDLRAQSHARDGSDAVIARKERDRRRWELKQTLNRQGGLCAICGEAMTLSDGPLKATIDHIVPRSAGGGEELSNKQAACDVCNKAKGSAL